MKGDVAMTTEEFEEFLKRSLKAIYKAYIETYGEENAYLNMFCAKREEGDGTYIAANNNHWELDKELKLDKFWRLENEQD